MHTEHASIQREQRRHHTLGVPRAMSGARTCMSIGQMTDAAQTELPQDSHQSQRMTTEWIGKAGRTLGRRFTGASIIAQISPYVNMRGRSQCRSKVIMARVSGPPLAAILYAPAIAVKALRTRLCTATGYSRGLSPRSGLDEDDGTLPRDYRLGSAGPECLALLLGFHPITLRFPQPVCP